MPAYYCFFPGDYLRDTIHLGQLEDLAYRRLLDLYYAKGKPLPNDRGYILRAIRAHDPDLQNAADNILSEFFTLTRDGWHNEKADRELERLQAYTERGKRGANARWHKNKDLINAKALHKHPTSNAPTPTPTPTEKTLKTRTPASRFVPPTLDEVQTYIAEKRYRVDAQRFLDHYTANGWKVGRNAMKDWQAAVRTWAAKSREPESGRLAI